MKVKLPTLRWFYQENVEYDMSNAMTGSLGTDPFLGCVNRKILHYSITPVKDKETEIIHFEFECYYEYNGDQSGEEQKQFAFSNEGIEQMEQLLDEKSKILEG